MIDDADEVLATRATPETMSHETRAALEAIGFRFDEDGPQSLARARHATNVNAQAPSIVDGGTATAPTHREERGTR